MLTGSLDIIGNIKRLGDVFPYKDSWITWSLDPLCQLYCMYMRYYPVCAVEQKNLINL